MYPRLALNWPQLPECWDYRHSFTSGPVPHLTRNTSSAQDRSRQRMCDIIRRNSGQQYVDSRILWVVLIK